MPRFKPVASPKDFGRFFEFTADLLPPGDQHRHYWCWHDQQPHCKGCWSCRDDAQRYAFPHHDGHGGWYVHAACTVPLHCVGQIKQPVNVLQDSALTGNSKLVEVFFDYGSNDMLNKRWAIPWQSITESLKFFDDKDEYDRLRAESIVEFEAAEAAVQQEINEDQFGMRDTLTGSADAWWSEHEKGPNDAVLRLSTRIFEDEFGIFYEVQDPERLVFHGMGTFLEKAQPGEIVITETARELLHRTGETRGMTGLNIHLKNLSWFGYQAFGFIDAEKGIFMQDNAHDWIDTLPTWDCSADGSVLSS